MQVLLHGQEIYLFFNKYNTWGPVGIVISMSLIAFIIYKVLKISYKNRDITNYSSFLDKIIGKKYITLIIQNIINIFLIISFYIMIAGFATYFNQEFGINIFLSSTVIAVFCYITFNKDIRGVIKVNSIIVPAIIIFILLLGATQLNEIKSTTLNFGKNNLGWGVSSILYASYNSILLIPMLIGLKEEIKKERYIKAISVICIIILIILAITIFFLIETIENLENIEMPLVYIAGKLKVIYKYLYGIVILSSIFTTAISAGYGFLNNVSKNQKIYSYLNLFICLSSIFVSNIGFSNLISCLYPVFGVLGIIQILELIRKK